MTAALGKSIIASLTLTIAAADARVVTLKPGITEVSMEYVVREGDTLRGAPPAARCEHPRSFKGGAL